MTETISSLCSNTAFIESSFSPTTYQTTSSECFNFIYIEGYLKLEKTFYDTVLIEVEFMIRNFLTRA